MKWGEKVTDIKEMEELYKDGKISRTSLWRGKKRGWIKPTWQQKKITSEATLDEVWKVVAPLQKDFLKIAITIYKQNGLSNDYAVCDDMAHDAMIHVVEKREIEYPLQLAKTYMTHYFKKGRYTTTTTTVANRYEAVL